MQRERKELCQEKKLPIYTANRMDFRAHNKGMSVKDLITGNNSIWIDIAVFVLGAGAYGAMEILFRGYTHWTMLITGGACILTIYYMREWMLGTPLVLGALAGALVITAYEFFVGIIVNLKFGWGVWDYSALPGNILGQICPAFTAIWFCVCFIFLGIIRIATYL